MFNRRRFLQSTSLAAVAAVMPRRQGDYSAFGRSPWLHVPSTSGMSTEPDLHALAARAAEAAKRAGATYADARVTLTRQQEPRWSESEQRGFGVRALVNGYWGFLSSAVWTPDEAVRLARGAVEQAKAHSRGRTRPVDLGDIPIVRGGEWVMPVKYDPFDIPVEEKLDIMAAFSDIAESAQVGISAQSGMSFVRQYRVFASSEGSSWAQTTYKTTASFAVYYRDEYHAGLRSAGAAVDFLSTAGVGWEYIADSKLDAAIPRLIDEAEQARHQIPVDVGRWDMVLSAEAMSAVLDQTLGAATELDRALGYEANATGTSYLDQPLAMLGTQRVASPHVSVTADRSRPGGVATVQWDDEGVVPEPFPIVADGVLVDFQTTREQSAWLAPYYQKTGHPIRSHGCAAASTALDITMQQTPNLALMPGRTPATFETMIAGVEKGIAVLDLRIEMDQQQLNGLGSGGMREIVHGKLGRYVYGGALVFRAPELWKSVTAVGGPGTQQWFGRARQKGEPGQSMGYSVGAVPVIVPQLSLIDATRKA